MSEFKNERPWFFSLRADGDSAVVRILHSNTSTIESETTHRIVLDGKNKKVKCLKENCPLCQSGNRADDRIYVHLFDYTDNKEKVWERTDKILPQLETLQQSWKPLNSAVVRITRKGNEFPRYNIDILPPTAYADVDPSLIDKPLAKFYSLSRKAEEVKTFVETGKFPERKEFIPKEEYYKQKQSQQEKSVETQVQPQSFQPQVQPQVNEPFKTAQPFKDATNLDDPFMDSFITPPRKV